MQITVNKAMVDYITCTTFDREIANNWHAELVTEFDVEEAKIKRYEGYRPKGRGEGIFIGESVGRAKEHYILQISGSDAEWFPDYITADMVKSGDVRVTRIDIQVTIDEPEGWSQVGYNATCERAGLKPEIKRSRNPVDRKKELITVYTGTKTSGRYNRCYQKVMESGLALLRYETEYSRGYAKAIAHGLLSGTVTREEIMRGEIRRRKLECLRVFDLWKCGLFNPKQEEREVTDKRAEWLVTDILPVFFEYINRHDANPRVLEAYVNAIMQREGR